MRFAHVCPRAQGILQLLRKQVLRTAPMRISMIRRAHWNLGPRSAVLVNTKDGQFFHESQCTKITKL